MVEYSFLAPSLRKDGLYSVGSVLDFCMSIQFVNSIVNYNHCNIPWHTTHKLCFFIQRKALNFINGLYNYKTEKRPWYPVLLRCQRTRLITTEKLSTQKISLCRRNTNWCRITHRWRSCAEPLVSVRIQKILHLGSLYLCSYFLVKFWMVPHIFCSNN